MLQIAESREGLKPCLATADAFFTSGGDMPKYNKILINESAHLFPDPQGSFCKAVKYLPVDGRLVLVTRSTQCTFPMWKAVKEKFAPVSVDKFREYLDRAGFNVQMTIEVGTTKMTKYDWYDKLRKRIFTLLHEFSDEEIEEGLKELDRDWFPGKEESDVVDIRDSLVYFTATKQCIA